jgi:hypothetical protein
MMGVVRMQRWAASVVVAGAIAACGSSPVTPSATQQPTRTPAPSSSAEPGGSPGDYIVATALLPPGDQTWEQIIDQPLNGTANTDQRAWQNADNSQRIEIDVLLDSSTTAAQHDYSTWSSQSTNTISDTTSRPDCPSSLGASLCNETIGTTSSNASEGLITWQLGRVLVAVVYSNGNGAVDRSYLESVATAENSQISSLIGA